MALQKLNLNSIKRLHDGRIAIAFQRQVERVVQDCLDRPGDGTARKVTLEFHFKPIPAADSLGGDGLCDRVEGYVEIKSKVPVLRSAPCDFRANTKGELIFNTNSTANFDQRTIDDVLDPLGEGAPDDDDD